MYQSFLSCFKNYNKSVLYSPIPRNNLSVQGGNLGKTKGRLVVKGGGALPNAQRLNAKELSSNMVKKIWHNRSPGRALLI
jgi:hypothetical protein